MDFLASETQIKGQDGSRITLDNGVQLLHLRCENEEIKEAWLKMLLGAGPPQGVVDFRKTVKYSVHATLRARGPPAAHRAAVLWACTF